MQDWEAVLRRGFESKELDYKGPCAWDEGDKKSCCEVVKDILAIANAKGGWIVVGVGEAPTGFSWEGLTDDQCKSFEASRLNRFLQNYADPPINTLVIKYPSQGRNFVIVEIPRFPDTPHICQKDYPTVLSAGTIYVRTDNNESAPIKNSADMRAIVEHATRNRADQLLASFRAILTSTPQPPAGPADRDRFDAQIRDAAARCKELIPKCFASLGFRETVIHPVKFERLRFTIPDIERMTEAASVSYRGWPFIFVKRADLIHQVDGGLEMLLKEQEKFQFWRLNQSGCLYVNEVFEEDERCFRRTASGFEGAATCEQSEDGAFPDSPKPGKLLENITFAYTCVEAVQCLVDLFTGRLADDEIIRLQMELRGVKGRHLAIALGNGYPYHLTTWQCDTDSIRCEQQHALADWRAGVIPHAFAPFERVIQKFNAPPPSYDEVAAQMQRLLNREL